MADQHGAMHRAETQIKQILFSFDLNNAFFRIDPHSGKMEDLLANGYGIQILFLPSFILSVDRKDDGTMRVALERERDDTWLILNTGCEVAVGSVMEIKIPFADLEAQSGDQIKFRLSLSQKGIVVEEHPQSGSIQFAVPGPHFEELDWEV